MGRYRIDVLEGDRLIEIQHSGLAAIRDKIQCLLADGHKVEVVKPLIARKQLVMLDRAEGDPVRVRWSPLQGGPSSLFGELLHFTSVFPHPALTLVAPMVEVAELRFPGHGRRRRWRRDDYQVQDRLLLKLLAVDRYGTAADLVRLLPGDWTGRPFNSADLARAMEVPRWQAQQIAWVLARTGAAAAVGRDRQGVRYELTVDPPPPAAASKRKRHRAA